MQVKQEPAELKLEALCKVYPGTVALKGFTHQFAPGKINALIGKNGSGKSTFTKMVAGAVAPTGGSIELNGLPLNLTCPQDALDQGIVTVYQELSLVPALSVAENIFLGKLPRRAFPFGRFVDWKKTKNDARELLLSIGCTIAADTLVSSLSVGQQQVVEIAKAIACRPRVLMLDEPTSALTVTEVNLLFTILRRLREQGVTMIYISHRLSELPEICDTVTVLRDGIHTGTVPIEAATPGVIMDLMFGEDANSTRATPSRRSEEVVLEVTGLSVPPRVTDVSFRLHKGEILGLAGMLGSGRTEILKAIYGADGKHSGEVVFHGQRVSHRDPFTMKSLGMGFTSENRKEDGLVQILSIRQNLCLAAMDTVARGPVISVKDENRVAGDNIRDLNVKISSLEDPVSSLSGGNQQKVVIGNWLNTDPTVLLFDEPSRGVDVHAKQQIFQEIWKQAELGRSSIIVSTELDELIEVCDRILVLRDGRIDRELYPEQTTIKELYGACMQGSTDLGEKTL